jgi:hypothetical protein
MILLGVRRLGSLANQLCADTPDDLPFASVISLQLAFGSASRSLELA